MAKFQVVSEYKPSGDQPQAIEALSRGIEMGLDEQTLLGVTGSGKTFTMAKIIEQVQRPTLSFSGRDIVSKSYRCGLERTGADIGTAPAGGDAIFAPASEEKSAMQGWNTLVVRPSIGEDGELSEPEAPAGARFPLPALPARAELRDAEVHAMLGELDFGESAVMGDATAEERQAIANFDIRAYA